MTTISPLSRTFSCFFLLSLLSMASSLVFSEAKAQTAAMPTTIEGWSDRLTRFGKAVPQEKVFVHLDNTCYFLGDTIWYAAYTRRTDTGRPSDISRVLYVELFNEEGYLVERQLVDMRGGRGHGNFVLPDTAYGGYYELRAYTRWQLNWGVTEKAHTSYAEDWFFSKRLAEEYYRDYEKLYSRVFPVYDRHQQPGDLYRDMTSRPLRRYFNSGAEEPTPTLSLFPEGGHLVAGVPNLVAFEAALEDGQALEGSLALPEGAAPSFAASVQSAAISPKPNPSAAPTISRGRGAFTITPEPGRTYSLTFTTTDGRTATATLPAAEPDGVALHIQSNTEGIHTQRSTEDIHIQLYPQGIPATKALGLTLMHEGRVLAFKTIEPQSSAITIPLSSLITPDSIPAGISQATIFDAEGRIWADRLFFLNHATTKASTTAKAESTSTKAGSAPAFSPTLSITGLKDQYTPFESATLEVVCPSVWPTGQSPATPQPTPPAISIAIRDAATLDATYDTADILTEMLLASELRGYIPDPAYFFEADDDEHRTALDLLMLTQGWRRFDWHTMATPGAFTLSQPAETQTPILRGEVLRYEASILQDDLSSFDDQTPTPYQLEESITRGMRDYDSMNSIRKGLTDSVPSTEDTYEGLGQAEVLNTIRAETYAHENGGFPAGSYRMRADISRSRFDASEGTLKREVRVHAEFAQPGSESIVGDMDTKNGQFTIPSPDFQGYCVFFLAASDTTKWKAGKTHIWIDVENEKSRDAEFYVRLAWPYPRFTQPYSYYQENIPTTTTGLTPTGLTPDPSPKERGVYTSANETPANKGNHSPLLRRGVGGEAGGSVRSATQMHTVTIRARHGGLRSFANLKPALTVDAYEAYNDACDAGLISGQYRGRFHYLNALARLYVGDMNSANSYLLEPRYNGRNVSFNFSAKQIDRFNHLTNLDSVSIYTDFQPRNGADPRATEDNIDRVTVDLREMPNEGQRLTYRDRRYILQGFNSPDAFYSPHYSLPAGATPPADYRRTLYWNPDLQLDANGRATVTFHTGSRPAILDITANGLAPDGTPLTN